MRTVEQRTREREGHRLANQISRLNVKSSMTQTSLDIPPPSLAVPIDVNFLQACLGEDSGQESDDQANVIVEAIAGNAGPCQAEG
jgi:hypothetical protein